MAHKGLNDIIEIGGLIFSNVIAGDFDPTRNAEAWHREMDGNGSFQDYENTDKSGKVTLTIRSDNKFGNQFKQLLRRYMETGERFTINRNNYNAGGQKEVYKGCLVINDGSSGKKVDGKLGNRGWEISYESYTVEEGKY